MYLNILILCAFLAQGIIGTFLEDDLRHSTKPLIRQKRVINRIPGRDVPIPATGPTQTVSIKRLNQIRCVGTVLSMKTVITAARCVSMDVSVYRVYAGSTYSERGLIHNITEKRIQGNHQVQGQSFETGIALIYVHPSFLTRRTNVVSIDLHSEPLLAGIKGMVLGWGSYHYGGRCETRHKGKLRAIEVPIMTHRDCVNSYRGFFNITDAYFCTHDNEQQCAYTDTGAGFIVDKLLAGIYLGFIQTDGTSHMKPDVFMMLQHSDYHQWILRNIE